MNTGAVYWARELDIPSAQKLILMLLAAESSQDNHADVRTIDPCMSPPVFNRHLFRLWQKGLIAHVFRDGVCTHQYRLNVGARV